MPSRSSARQILRQPRSPGALTMLGQILFLLHASTVHSGSDLYCADRPFCSEGQVHPCCLNARSHPGTTSTNRASRCTRLLVGSRQLVPNLGKPLNTSMSNLTTKIPLCRRSSWLAAKFRACILCKHAIMRTPTCTASLSESVLLDCSQMPPCSTSVGCGLGSESSKANLEMVKGDPKSTPNRC